MVKAIYIPIFIMIFTLSSCVQELPITPTPTPSSGVEGHVTEGPICPGPVVISSTQLQDQPYQATLSILDATNKPITQFQTDGSGYFKVNLSPGMYILHPESNNAYPRAADQPLVVAAGQFTQVTIVYDTGILGACAQDMPTTPPLTPSSGIEGLVTEGPMCPGPVAIGDTQCEDRPYQATIFVLDANNKQIYQFQTDTTGYFTIPLAPGSYFLHPQSEKAYPRAADQPVVVTAGQFTQISIKYDTGMR
jgi:hypothetical protein